MNEKSNGKKYQVNKKVATTSPPLAVFTGVFVFFDE